MRNSLDVDMHVAASNFVSAIQSFKAVGRGMLQGLSVLHSKGLRHRDPRAPNVVWQHPVQRDAVILVDLDLACGSNAELPENFLAEWDEGTLDSTRHYTAASDVYQAGKSLQALAIDKPWAGSAKQFCDDLLSKKLTAVDALGHSYLA